MRRMPRDKILDYRHCEDNDYSHYPSCVADLDERRGIVDPPGRYGHVGGGYRRHLGLGQSHAVHGEDERNGQVGKEIGQEEGSADRISNAAPATATDPARVGRAAADVTSA